MAIPVKRTLRPPDMAFPPGTATQARRTVPRVDDWMPCPALCDRTQREVQVGV